MPRTNASRDRISTRFRAIVEGFDNPRPLLPPELRGSRDGVFWNRTLIATRTDDDCWLVRKHSAVADTVPKRVTAVIHQDMVHFFGLVRVPNQAHNALGWLYYESTVTVTVDIPSTPPRPPAEPAPEVDWGIREATSWTELQRTLDRLTVQLLRANERNRTERTRQAINAAGAEILAGRTGAGPPTLRGSRMDTPTSPAHVHLDSVSLMLHGSRFPIQTRNCPGPLFTLDRPRGI